MTVPNRIVEAARWGIAHAARIHYGSVRPIPLRRTLPLTTDCSGFATLCYFLAGAPDPNGRRYDGSGWTGTLLSHMRHVPREQAGAGDLVIWGAYPGHHVAVLLDDADDPLLCSHGMEQGPLEVRFSEESRAQPAPVAWLTLPD